MLNKQNIIGVIAVLALVVAVIGLVGGNSAKLGGTTNYDDLHLTTLTVTGTSTLATTTTTGTNMALGGYLIASSTITTLDTLTAATGTFSGPVSGTKGTFTGFGLFGSAASSTVQIGAASKGGCLILGDSANGSSVVYITATGGTVTASTTKPQICQTAQ